MIDGIQVIFISWIAMTVSWAHEILIVERPPYPTLTSLHRPEEFSELEPRRQPKSVVTEGSLIWWICLKNSENVHRFSLVHSILCSINLPFWESNYHHSSTQLWRKIKSGKLKCLNGEQSITLCMICASCITSETDVVRNLAIWFAVLILCWTLLMFWIETLVYRVCHSVTLLFFV